MRRCITELVESMSDYNPKTWLDTVLEENKTLKEENQKLKEEKEKILNELLELKYMESRKFNSNNG